LRKSKVKSQKSKIKSQKSKVKSQKAYRADFLAIWNGWFIYADLYYNTLKAFTLAEFQTGRLKVQTAAEAIQELREYLNNPSAADV
jgi:hypothetical protein